MHFYIMAAQGLPVRLRKGGVKQDVLPSSIKLLLANLSFLILYCFGI